MITILDDCYFKWCMNVLLNQILNAPLGSHMKNKVVSLVNTNKMVKAVTTATVYDSHEQKSICGLCYLY